MAFPIGLGLYLFATARRARPASGDAAPFPGRPAGPLVWFPVLDRPSPALPELIRRLQEAPEPPEILVTTPTTPVPGAAIERSGTARPQPLALPEDIWQLPAPADTLPDMYAFIDHWRPDLVVLSGDALPPALLRESDRAHVPVQLIDARPPRPGHPKRFPGVVSTLLQGLSLIATSDAGTARALRRLGAPDNRIEIVGALHADPIVLPYVEAEREALAQLTRTRPIWLVAGLPEAEEDLMIEAHRAALRRAHRLLLIVVPEDPARGPELARKMEAGQGWTVACRSADEDPEEEAQVYVADTEGEMGLWYRLSPITCMGGSFSAVGSLHSPLEPAALGSAILHGPQPGAHRAAYARLVDAQATRMLPRPGELGTAVAELIAPDLAAHLARNAWEASTAGADVVDRVAAMILAALHRARLGAG